MDYEQRHNLRRNRNVGRLLRFLLRGALSPLLALLLSSPVWTQAAENAASRLQQTVNLQSDVRAEALRTVVTLRELADELVFNRFSDPTLARHVDAVGKTLESAGNEYMEKAAQELRSLLDLADNAARKGKLDEVARLQDVILKMLADIRNARLAADRGRLRRLLDSAIRSQRAAMERTKAILFDARERIPAGKDAESLTSDERERLEHTSVLQGTAEGALRKAMTEIASAAAQKAADLSAQAAAATKVHAFLADARTLEKSGQARADLDGNRSTQALKTEKEILDTLEEALKLLTGETAEADRKIAELAAEKEAINALLEEERTLHKEVSALGRQTPDAEFKTREGVQDRLAQKASTLAQKMDSDSLARLSMNQATEAMGRAAEHLKDKSPVPATDEMALTEKALEAALMALDKQMADLAAGTKDDAEAALKTADELKKEADAAAQMSKDLEEAAKKEQAIENQTKEAAEQKKNSSDVARDQEQLAQRVQQLQQNAQQKVQQMQQGRQAMQQAAQAMQGARQSMQEATQQLQDNQPQAALSPEQQAQQALQQAAQALQQAAQNLRQMEQAARMQAMAAQLNQMARKEASLLAQANQAKTAEQMKAVEASQQELRDKVGQAQEKANSQNIQSPQSQQSMQQAQDNMQQAQGSLQKAQKEPGKGGGQPMQKARQQMMSAQSALQQAAQQMQQGASQQMQTANQQMQNGNNAKPGGKPSNNMKPPGKAGQGGGNLKEGDSAVTLGEKKKGPGWDASMSERDRVKFGQDSERNLPPEYSRIVEGYYRRLAKEGSKQP